MLRIIDVFTPVKVEMMSEEIGLDESIHGEHAYETPEVEDSFNFEHQVVVSTRSGIARMEEEELIGPGK